MCKNQQHNLKHVLSLKPETSCNLSRGKTRKKESIPYIVENVYEQGNQISKSEQDFLDNGFQTWAAIYIPRLYGQEKMSAGISPPPPKKNMIDASVASAGSTSPGSSKPSCARNALSRNKHGGYKKHVCTFNIIVSTHTQTPAECWSNVLHLRPDMDIQNEYSVVDAAPVGAIDGYCAYHKDDVQPS